MPSARETRVILRMLTCPHLASVKLLIEFRLNFTGQVSTNANASESDMLDSWLGN
jgi:hypothetical protein